MSGFSTSGTKRLGLVSILLLLAIAAIVGGCRSSNEATLSEGFFEPLKSVNPPSSPKPSRVANAKSPSPSDQLADSLLNRRGEQERRIGAITGQLQRLETSGKGQKADSSRPAGKQTIGVSQPKVQPVPGKYEEFLRQYEAGQYKAASEGFQAVLRSGVPKDVEDQCRYMIGMSHFKLRQFDLAAASLTIVANRKGSKLRGDAYFVLGQTYKQLGASRQAKTMFEAVLRESSKADLTEAARKELRDLEARK